MTVMNSSIIKESDFRHDGIHLNEIGVTKLIEHVDNFLRNSGMKTVIKNSNGFLADRPYRKILREYIFGCKQCSELTKYILGDFNFTESQLDRSRPSKSTVENDKDISEIWAKIRDKYELVDSFKAWRN